MNNNKKFPYKIKCIKINIFEKLKLKFNLEMFLIIFQTIVCLYLELKFNSVVMHTVFTVYELTILKVNRF